METRVYSSDTNIQFDKSLNYINPDILYRTIDLIKRRHGKFEVTGPSDDHKEYLLGTGIIGVYDESTEDSFPKIAVNSRTKSGLKRILASLSLPLGHAPRNTSSESS